MAEINLINLSEIENFKDLSPDFYKSDYMAKSLNIRSGSYRRLSQISYITDGEHGSPCWSNDSGIKYITAEFIKENFIGNGDFKQITVDQDQRNARARLQKDDILIYSVGAYAGLTCVAEPHLFPANIPRSVAIVRLNNTDEFYPEFISVFLNSQFGKFQSLRFRAGNSQPVLALEKIRQFEVPLVDILFQKEIAELYQKSYELRKISNNLYQQATTLLEKELGLDTFTFQKPTSYTASFSEVLAFSRIDGEHFQPKFRNIRELIESYPNGFERLTSKIKVVKPDYQLKNHPTNTIHYIELSNINPSMGYIDYIEEMDIKKAPSRAKRLVITGDVIASSVVGSVDKAGLVSDTENGYIASNGFFQFRSDYYSPEFLLLLIKSNFVKEQFHQQSTGGILSAVPDQNLKYIIFPKIDVGLQNQITNLVRESHIKFGESKQLIEQANNRVVELIEKVATK